MRRPPAPEHLKWLKAIGYGLGPLTGTDYRALAAVDAIWALLGYVERPAVLEAARAVLPLLQSKCWPMARELIARHLDWGDRDRVWLELGARFDIASPVALR